MAQTVSDKGGYNPLKPIPATKPRPINDVLSRSGRNYSTKMPAMRAVAPAPAPAPVDVSTNTTSVQPFSTSRMMAYDAGGAGAGGAGAPVVNPDVDYLQEAGYLAQVSALDRALQEFQNQDTAERSRYDVDFSGGLRDLGYRDENIDDDISGQWDWNDVLTASGRGYQQNLNDFASRGMLESQGYFDSLKNLERSLEDQRGAMNTSRQNFRRERDEGLTNYQNQDKASRDAARIAAIERLSASLGLV